VSAGSAHACALRTDRTVACWGDDTEGEASPPGGTFAAVSAGTNNTCGLKTDRTVACWGRNLEGESTPPAGTFVSVAVGYLASCGVRTNSVFQCWGQNDALGGAMGTSVNLPRLAIGDASVVEGASASRALKFTVSVGKATLVAVTAHYATVSGTALAGSDFDAASGTVTIPAGSTSAAVAVAVNGDTVVEPNEIFTVKLSSPTGPAILGKSTGFGTIINDDPSSGARLSIGDALIVEGRVGSRLVRLNVTLSAPQPVQVAAHFATIAGTAHAGSDFVAASGTVIMPAGTTSAIVAIAVNGDGTVEPNESFTVQLSRASGAVLGKADGTATILNDD
jgi:chitinase